MGKVIKNILTLIMIVVLYNLISCIVQLKAKENEMFGLKYIKTQPTMYLFLYNRGKIKREGAGQSFFYYAPASTLIAVPIGSQDSSFMMNLATADFQEVTVQGQVTYRITDPNRIVQMMDFSLKNNGKAYTSEDPTRLGDRIIMQTEVIIQREVQSRALKEALCSSAQIAQATQQRLQQQTEINALGIEILGVSIVAIRPTPDIARALEAQAREEHLKAADEAIYSRRISAVENERAIRQNELDTEIAVEQKKSEIQQAQMMAKAEKIRKENELRNEQMGADIDLEEKRKALVGSQTANNRSLAEAEAYKVAVLMEALEKADPRIIQALAAVGMKPSQLIAQAFGGIAEKAERIGQLNMSPELLNALMNEQQAGGTRKANN